MPIKETYLAILKKMREKHPNAHFEVITATAKSPLAPSWELLKTSKQMVIDTGKSKKVIFDEYYTPNFLDEIKNNPKAQSQILILAQMSLTTTVYLVCYEKDSTICHRSLILKLIQEKKKLLQKLDEYFPKKEEKILCL